MFWYCNTLAECDAQYAKNSCCDNSAFFFTSMVILNMVFSLNGRCHVFYRL